MTDQVALKKCEVSVVFVILSKYMKIIQGKLLSSNSEILLSILHKRFSIC